MVSLRFARAGKAPKQRIALLSVFVAATSLSMVVAPYARPALPRSRLATGWPARAGW